MTIKFKQVGGITTITSKAQKISVGFIKRGRMVEVATSFCAPMDKFKRKFGRETVVYRLLFTEQSIFLPIGQYSDNEVKNVVENMFFNNFLPAN